MSMRLLASHRIESHSIESSRYWPQKTVNFLFSFLFVFLCRSEYMRLVNDEGSIFIGHIDEENVRESSSTDSLTWLHEWMVRTLYAIAPHMVHLLTTERVCVVDSRGTIHSYSQCQCVLDDDMMVCVWCCAVDWYDLCEFRYETRTWPLQRAIERERT